jgi:DNA invertase Pin-like site-specific DNA recombinase
MGLTARKFIRTQQEDPATSRNSTAQWIVKRANDGRAAARRRGVHMGRKPKLTELQRRVARERVAKGESARAIAREWGVAHTTVARVVA